MRYLTAFPNLNDAKKSKIKIRHGAKDNIHVEEPVPKTDKSTMKAVQSEEEKVALEATSVSAAANLLFGVSKGVIGIAVNSTALIADAASCLGDLLCDGVVFYSVVEARKRATPDRPWGRGKFESLGALSIGGLLLLTGAGIGYTAFFDVIHVAASTQYIPVNWLAVNSISDLFTAIFYPSLLPPPPTEAVEAINQVIRDSAENSSKAIDLDLSKISLNQKLALGISGFSIVGKELLFRYILHAGEKANSAAVIANAWQHRSDVSTSFAVFVGLIGATVGYELLDPLAGLLVSGVITKQAYTISGEALRELSDIPADEAETDELRQTCLKVSGVLSVETIRARKSGPFLFVEVTVGVNGNISASAAHRLSELTRLALLKKHSGRVAGAAVDVTPLGSAGLGEHSPKYARDHDYIVEEVKKAALLIKEVISVSEVQVYYKDGGHISTKVDIVLSPNLTIQQAHQIAVKVRGSINKTLPAIDDIDVDLELDETF